MKLLVAALLALGSQLAVLPEPPGPIVHGPKGVVAAGDTITYTVSWGPGARATSYDVAWSVSATNGTWAITADSNGSGKWAPVPPAAPNGVGALPTTANVTWTALKTWLAAVPWDSATFTVTVTSRNSFGTSATSSTATWRLLRKPGPPGPIIVDSSKIVTATLVLPQTMTLALGASRTVCAFKQFGNGAIAEWTADKAACDSIYVAYVPFTARQAVQPAQQAHTDSTAVTCVTWQSSLPAAVALVPKGSCSAAATVTGTGLTARLGDPFFPYGKL